MEKDFRYKKQQKTIKEVCKELNLIPYYPDYHAKKRDNNTVLIYTQEAAKHNKNRLAWQKDWRENEYPYLCSFENSDVNGMFDINFMNYGTLDLRGINEKEKIKNYLLSKLKNE